MKIRVLIILCSVVISGFLFAQEPLREWTNKEGKAIEARMLSQTDETVTLMLSNGRMYVVPLNTLSESDNAYVKKAQSTPATRNVPKGGWFEDMEDAKTLAASENKPVLALFTGSDWCPPCKRLEGAVLSKKEFKEFAEKELVLMEVDFPRNKKQSSSLKKANQKLQSEYNIRGYPTLLLMDAKGKVLAKISTGARSPEELIQSITSRMP